MSDVILGIFVGIITSFFAFLLKERVLVWKNKKIENKKYAIVLESTKNEASFYLDKLRQLSNDISDTITSITSTQAKSIISQNKSQNIRIPSYSLYPDFLEKSKIEINSFFRNSDLVKDIGECHFELCHILERLNFFKNEFKKPFKQLHIPTTIQNLRGFKSLIDKNIKTFKHVILDIDKKLSIVKKKI